MGDAGLLAVERGRVGRGRPVDRTGLGQRGHQVALGLGARDLAHLQPLEGLRLGALAQVGVADGEHGRQQHDQAQQGQHVVADVEQAMADVAQEDCRPVAGRAGDCAQADHGVLSRPGHRIGARRGDRHAVAIIAGCTGRLRTAALRACTAACVVGVPNCGDDG